jgi:acetolactate decarboxylase
MKRNYFVLIAVVIILVFVVVPGFSLSCTSSKYAENPVANRETLTQISTINALMAGVYDGIMPAGTLKGYGDFGIGTLDGLDGEMIELDGKVYQVKTDGGVYPVSDSVKVPFAAVTFFDNDLEEKLSVGLNYAGLQESLDKLIPSANIFAAIKISGTFSYVKTRSVPKQSKPYPVLTEVTKNQSVFELKNVSGTVIGFKCPQYVNGVNVPGYHLHFLTDDFEAGGHLLELTTEDAIARLDFTPEFLMVLPDMASDFYKIDLSGNQQSNIQKAEK